MHFTHSPKRDSSLFSSIVIRFPGSSRATVFENRLSDRYACQISIIAINDVGIKDLIFEGLESTQLTKKGCIK